MVRRYSSTRLGAVNASLVSVFCVAIEKFFLDQKNFADILEKVDTSIGKLSDIQIESLTKHGNQSAAFFLKEMKVKGFD